MNFAGTQWDGLRHFGILKGGCFYQVRCSSCSVGGADQREVRVSLRRRSRQASSKLPTLSRSTQTISRSVARLALIPT